MDNEKEKFERFLAAVMAGADRKAGEIIKETEDKREEILSSARTAAEDAGKRHIKDSERMNAGRFTREIAKAEQDMKHDLYRCREDLTDEMFDSIRSRLENFTALDAYRTALTKSISAEDTTGAEIHVSVRDAEHLAGIPGITADEDIVIGGYSIVYKDRGICIDKTFDSALSEQRERFSSRNIYENGVEN
ncbi:MAG: hypothetical protein ILP19_00195 [Oscillospiraceae bacterium]|nr:hypothetical protein [Oscillospiraceae bacterium]